MRRCEGGVIQEQEVSETESEVRDWMAVRALMEECLSVC